MHKRSSVHEGFEVVAQLLIIDDCPDNTLLLSRVMETYGHEVTSAADGLSGIECALATAPEVILLDLLMPGIDGCATCRRLKANPATADIPVLIVSACEEEEKMVEAFDAGAHDYVMKPFLRTVVAARVRAAVRLSQAHREREQLLRCLETANGQLEVANRESLRLAREDPLLGIGNRRAMEISLDHIHELSIRYHRPYSLLLFDVDHFKGYNDRYGHPAGDVALQKVAQRIVDSLRKSDRVYRYGGEELLAMLPETELQFALQTADRVREEIARMAVEFRDSPIGCLSVSVGVACCPGATLQEISWKGLVEHADQALYAAKEGGRNRVEAALALAVRPGADGDPEIQRKRSRPERKPS